MFFKQGSVIQFTEGQYSEYHNVGVYLVTQDFDAREALTQFRHYTTDSNTSNYNYKWFIQYLSLRGIVQEINCTEVDLGAWGELPYWFVSKRG